MLGLFYEFYNAKVTEEFPAVKPLESHGLVINIMAQRSIQT